MCGIMGIVTDPNDRTTQDPQPLLASLQNQELNGALETLEPGIDRLFAFPSLRQVMLNPEKRDAIHSLADKIGQLIEDCDQKRSQNTSTEVQEQLSSLNIRLKDAQWRLKEDLLPNITAIAHLAQGHENNEKLALELWKLNALLGGLDRLEVRGRDSAGISVQVAFDNPEALQAFEKSLEAEDLLAHYQGRIQPQNFIKSAIFKGDQILLFALKVAEEIGELGDNVSALRHQLMHDAILQRAMGLKGSIVTPLAHTRWASNGVISEANCHPITDEYFKADAHQTHGEGLSVVLNGDIDNFQQLKQRLQDEDGITIAPEVTTDAKSIPLWITHYLKKGVEFGEAFRLAMNDFEGSMAIALQNSDEPGTVYLALKGSGQSIYIGQTHGGFIFASELYGLVEETSRFWKMDGEKPRIPGDLSTQGQIVVLRPATKDSPCTASGFWLDGAPLNLSDKEQEAEITTRDINRANYPHFLLKEITEAVHSVEKTLRGKYRLTEHGPTFPFFDELTNPAIREGLKSGRINRILCIGQGTAAIAAQGIAGVMGRLLRNTPLQIKAMKATELSAFYLRERMDDTLIIAVSQSGTTTDTNRTVDMAKDRNAHILAIVNRRNSDLVYKAEGVFYTSDGRDIEMSVASTKAFYAQVAAGYLMALALAKRMHASPTEVLSDELDGLRALPTLIPQVLERQDEIRQLAETFVVKHRHWAVVGSGTNFVAAEEIRIKLSELCYKAIPVDFTEDKKHIDLSSEPLILICAAGLEPDLASDTAKEVAIFKAHKACPIVITTDGQDLYDPYAAGVLKVPSAHPGVAFILGTVAGHLWSYFAARALDGQGQALRKLRAKCVDGIERAVAEKAGLDTMMASLRHAVGPEVAQIQGWLLRGELNSGLTASVAVRLSLLLKVLSKRLTVDDLYLDLGAQSTASPEALGALMVDILTQAVEALTRPIDAIKHQAKTVTVGISRSEAPKGLLFESLGDLHIETGSILPSHKQSLEALTPLIADVKGAVLYDISALDLNGLPTADSRIQVRSKHGIAANLTSRLEKGGALAGTKREIIARRRLFVGVGGLDGRSVLLFPIFTGSKTTGVGLLHVEFDQKASIDDRKNALMHYRSRYEQMIGQFAERNMLWNDAYLASLSPNKLFEGSIGQLIQELEAQAEA